MATTDHKWAAGFDNEANLKSVELDVPAFQGMPLYVRSNGPGTQQPEAILRPRADSTSAETGFQVFIWMADAMSESQYNYIRATYTPGGTGYTAKMTVRTLLGDSGTPNYTPVFANFNAVLQLPTRSGMSPILNAFTAVPLRFVVKEAL